MPGGECMRHCARCPDRRLCDVLDDPDIQFWPGDTRLAEICRRLGREVSAEEVARVEKCLLEGKWLPTDCREANQE